MADDPITQLNTIGQKALTVPTDILSVGTRRMTEDMSMLSAKVQDIGTTLIPAGGLGLPPLPTLPGMGGAGTEAAVPPAQSRSEKTQGVRKTRKTSYLRV